MAGSVGSDGREEILTLQIVSNLVQLLAISGKENATSSWSVADSDHIALNVGRAIGVRCERLIVPAVTGG